MQKQTGSFLLKKKKNKNNNNNNNNLGLKWTPLINLGLRSINSSLRKPYFYRLSFKYGLVLQKRNSEHNRKGFGVRNSQGVKKDCRVQWKPSNRLRKERAVCNLQPHCTDQAPLTSRPNPSKLRKLWAAEAFRSAFRVSGLLLCT